MHLVWLRQNITKGSNDQSTLFVMYNVCYHIIITYMTRQDNIYLILLNKNNNIVIIIKFYTLVIVNNGKDK